MPLISGKLSTELRAFILATNKMKQEDADKAIDTYCKNLEKVIYEAIRSITLVIPTGMIQVQGTPSAQVNINPIELKDVVQ